MEELVKKYANKLYAHRLCSKDAPVIGGIDAETVWNRDAEEIPVLEKIIKNLNINSILFSRPEEPFFSILNYLSKIAENQNYTIRPQDTESRTFLHDIPVARNFDPEIITAILKKRKSAVIPGYGIIATGTVSPEQAFVTFSSVCFSLYVKLLSDYANSLIMNTKTDQEHKKIAGYAVNRYSAFMENISSLPKMKKGPFHTPEATESAMIETGKLTIESGMVDSFFGNISYRLGDTIYISQTGSSLDELEGCIDPCPIDNSTSNAVTASSEFSAHKSVYQTTDKRAILHGHPKYSVITSMLCDRFDCKERGMCHIKCKETRSIKDIQIVPGEVGTGPTGLCNTLPPALTARGAIVYGHGLFTTGAEDFTDAFKSLIDIEKMCLERYLEITRF